MRGGDRDCVRRSVGQLSECDGEGSAMTRKLLGHTQVQATARYAHLASDPVKQAATKISDRQALALFGTVDDPKIPGTRTR
jgi:integrase